MLFYILGYIYEAVLQAVGSIPVQDSSFIYIHDLGIYQKTWCYAASSASTAASTINVYIAPITESFVSCDIYNFSSANASNFEKI